jgi:serine/threonine protein kinase
MKDNLAANLQTIRDAQVSALQLWLSSEEASAAAIAEEPQVRSSLEELAKLGSAGIGDAVREPLRTSKSQAALRDVLQPMVDSGKYGGYVAFTANGRIIAALKPELLGVEEHPLSADVLAKVFHGAAVVSRPLRSISILADRKGVAHAGVPIMLALGPVRDKSGKVIAALGMRIKPEVDFARLLAIGRSGKTGETFAFDAQGTLLSESRFDDELKALGLIPDNEASDSMLTLELRDPGLDLRKGHRPVRRRHDQPLTFMAASATSGQSGENVDGYRDARGVPVVGAWRWLPEYGMGIATEMEAAEAFRPLVILQWAIRGLLALLVLMAVAIFVFGVVVARMNRNLRRAVLESKRLGQYTLQEKLGAGGMGVVYRACHMMLRRPTAIKLLDIEKTNVSTIARFEREVQLTSQLTHPNTIAVYDFGRTPEGVFYYAMEFLEGISLDKLVRQYGPQPEARVVAMARQICGSLAEAHATDLIHRDIKPANLMLTRRGGQDDVVKVLDFGLVKSVHVEEEAAITHDGTLAGTPLYMSPEAVQTPDRIDGRADIYSLGAVLYYLLTGTAPFGGSSVVEICMNHVSKKPESLSERLGRPISPDLEQIVLRCLSKSPDERPQSADELANALEECVIEDVWSKRAASEWWRRYSMKGGDEPADAPDAVTGRNRESKDMETMLIEAKKVLSV